MPNLEYTLFQNDQVEVLKCTKVERRTKCVERHVRDPIVTETETSFDDVEGHHRVTQALSQANMNDPLLYLCTIHFESILHNDYYICIMQSL